LGFNSRQRHLFTSSITTGSIPPLTSCPLSTVLAEGSRYFGQIEKINASSSLRPFEYLAWRTQEKEFDTTFPTKAWFTDERSEGLPGSGMREDR